MGFGTKLLLLLTVVVYIQDVHLQTCNRPMDDDAEAVIETFLQGIVDLFAQQAQNRRHQFAVLVLLPHTRLSNNEYDLSLIPPVDWTLDNNQVLSPAHPSLYVNYVVARTSMSNGAYVHAEQNLLPELPNLLAGYRCLHNGEDPAAIMLYSWIIPCTACTRAIIRAYVTARPLMPNLISSVPFYIGYTTQGFMGAVGEEREEIRRNNSANIQLLRAYRFMILRGNCQHPRNQYRERRAVIDEEVEVCQIDNTVQGCMYQWLVTREVYLREWGNPIIAANTVNMLLKHCQDKKNFRPGCAEGFLENLIGDANLALNQNKPTIISAAYTGFNSCLGKEKSLIISKPLDVHNPTTYPGPLTHYEDLQVSFIQTAGSDRRSYGLWNSLWKSEYLAKGGKLCRDNHPCGTHGYTYTWCNLQAGSWEYCTA